MARRKKIQPTPEEALQRLLPAIAHAETDSPWDSGRYGQRCLILMGIYLRAQGIEIKTPREYAEEAGS